MNKYLAMLFIVILQGIHGLLLGLANVHVTQHWQYWALWIVTMAMILIAWTREK